MNVVSGGSLFRRQSKVPDSRIEVVNVDGRDLGLNDGVDMK